MRGWLRENLHLKVISLIVTLTLYLSVKVEKTTVRTFRIDVNVTDILGDIVLMEEPEDVTLTVRGSGRALSRIDDERLRSFSIGPIRPDTTRWPVRPEAFALPSGIEILSVEPTTLRLDPVPLIELELPVVANFRGQVPTGYEVLSSYVDPPMMTVSMPETYLGTVDTLHTETIDLAGLVQSISRPVRLSVQRRFVTYGADIPVTVNVEVGVVEDIRLVETVPIVLTGSDAGRCSSSTESLRLTVRGPRTVVESMISSEIFASIPCNEWVASGPGVYSVEPELQNVPPSLEVQHQPRVVRVTVSELSAPTEEGAPEDSAQDDQEE